MTKKLNTEEWDKRIWGVWTTILSTLADGTQKSYLLHYARFAKRFDLTAGQMYEMRKADRKSDEPVDGKRFENMVKTLMSEMKKDGYAASTQSHVKNAMSSFFDSMGMELHFSRRDKPKGQKKGQRMITKAQICELREHMFYSYCRKRNIAILLTLKDCGLRISDLRLLNYGHYVNAETVYDDRGDSFKVFDPELTLKKAILAYIHLGPESIAPIDEYLKERQDNGETLTAESALFLDRFARVRVTRVALTSVIRTRALRLKMKDVSAHSLRKFHRTRLQKTLNDQWINKLQGKVADPYSKPEEDGDISIGFGDLTAGYIKSYDNLRVLEKPRDNREEERLREELERVRAQRPPELTIMLDRLDALEHHIYNKVPSRG